MAVAYIQMNVWASICWVLCRLSWICGTQKEV